MPCLVFSMSLLSFFLKNPREKLLRSLQALGPPSGSVAVGTASKPQLKAGQVFSARIFGTTEISLTNGEKPTQNDPKLKNSCVKQFFPIVIFILYHFICFVWQILLLTSKTYQDNLPRATLIIYPPLRDSHGMTCALSSGRRLFRTLPNSCWSGKSIPSCRVWTVHIKTSYRLQIWHLFACEHDLSNFGNFIYLGDEWTGNFGILWLKQMLHHSCIICI